MFVGEKLTDIRLLHGYSRNGLAKLVDVSEQSIRVNPRVPLPKRSLAGRVNRVRLMVKQRLF